MGVPASLLTIPAMAPLIVSSFLAAAGGVVFEPLGVLLGWIATAPTAYLIAVVSALPSWTIEANWVDRPLLAVWYGGLGLALLAAQPHRTRRWRQGMRDGAARLRSALSRRSEEGTSEPKGEDKRPRWPLPHPYAVVVAALALGAAAVILWLRVADGPDGNLHVYFLDIGQGDSTLIVTPSGRQVLIDGGPDGDVASQRLAEVLPSGDRSLDLMVMTHLDSDHSHGLLEVLDRYTVGAVLTGVYEEGNAMQGRWEQRLDLHAVAPVEVRAGHSILLEEGVELEVLNPPQERLLGDSNNDSVVLRLTYGETSVLLTGDIEEEAERRLVNSDASLMSTVLKVGHHGSGTSTTQRFLNAVSPRIAVISAGADNPYGHPSPVVVERLEGSVGDSAVFRTDRHGTVEVVSDGETVWVRTGR